LRLVLLGLLLNSEHDTLVNTLSDTGIEATKTGGRDEADHVQPGYRYSELSTG